MEITQIKQQLSIHQVLAHYGLAIKNNHIHCPFHNDTTPSMRVYADTGSVFCFSGNCEHGNKSIDVIDFILHKENCTKHKAIVKAKEMLGITTPTKSIQSVYKVLNEQLPRCKTAVQYLKNRGLENLTDIGSNHRNGGNQVAYQYPKLKNCIIFPLRDKYANVVSLYGRSFTTTKQNGHFYLTGRTGLYPSYPPTETKHLILTESIIDTATLLLHTELPKDTAVLACYGTNGFTQEHTQCINQLLSLRAITIFFDGDTAGRTATAKLQQQLAKQYPKLAIKTVATPQDEDINSLWVNNESKELFSTLIKEATTTPSFSIEEKIKPDTQNPIPETSKINDIEIHYQEVTPVEKEQEVTKNNPLTFTIKGKPRCTGDSLKLTLETKNTSNHNVIIQKLDLYDYNTLEKAAKQASKVLDISTETLIQHWQNFAITIETQQQEKEQKENVYTMDKAIQTRCIDFLKSPDLLQKINDTIGRTGIVGEVDNRLLLFLIAISYQSKNPLHGLIQGSSGSGKTKLLQSIYNLIPPEQYKSLTRVTESSFYNYGTEALQHKLLCFEDLDGLKEEALLALRELQSNGSLTSATAQKLESGKIQSTENTVNGPIASLACTTKADVYEDNISRCFVIAVDESIEQTNKIIEYQNQIAKGTIDTQEQKRVTNFVQNCIRVLQPVTVVNPFADRIKLPKNIHKLRRLHSMYQNLVAQVTYLHQYQRDTDKKGRIIATKQDLQIACTILLETIILKVDELHGSLRQFFETLKKGIQPKGVDHSFNRFEVRTITGLGITQTRKYLDQLVTLEYLQQFGYANRGYRYKISFWDHYSVLKTKIQKDLQSQIDTILAS